jgi:hypothetical protein
MKQIREDFLDAYLFIQRKLNDALTSAGDLSRIQTDRICCMGCVRKNDHVYRVVVVSLQICLLYILELEGVNLLG